MLKQETLFIIAMKELGQRVPKSDLETDHLAGTIVFRGQSFGLTFPRTGYYLNAVPSQAKRNLDFYFQGFIPDSGGRSDMLRRFQAGERNFVKNSSWGRLPLLKKINGPGYLDRFKKSKFSLCPMHTDWPGPPRQAWSYRFAEAVFFGSVPVVFRKAPLGEDFLDGFKYFWDDEVLDSSFSPSESQMEEMVGFNLIQSRRFFLSTKCN